ncbi:hypothetical protein BDV39DRAFT_168724 [Aspergillus sergii]|uniref:Uncharacterized protein n=1 Tax=Aspergillus sergii TaxID=1034303 RepID=A0A5N6XG66_9EURO|nr:hypothetical protein BDV39DRAFT_168724 [Aspergillus sergii]
MTSCPRPDSSAIVSKLFVVVCGILTSLILLDLRILPQSYPGLTPVLPQFSSKLGLGGRKPHGTACHFWQRTVAMPSLRDSYWCNIRSRPGRKDWVSSSGRSKGRRRTCGPGSSRVGRGLGGHLSSYRCWGHHFAILCRLLQISTRPHFKSFQLSVLVAGHTIYFQNHQHRHNGRPSRNHGGINHPPSRMTRRPSTKVASQCSSNDSSRPVSMASFPAEVQESSHP